MALHKLEPSFREKVWGTTHLAPWFLNSESKIGEVWYEVAGFPLLVKFLFTTEKLSVQVHPDDTYARIHHSSRGKTEMWHILAAEPGAQIAAGFAEPVTREQAREAALSGQIESLLEWHQAAAGDTFFIPAGTVHAIGAGLVLCEIQEYSDVTYRLYDYGRPRELHLDDGIAVSQLGPQAVRRRLPVECEHFVTERLELSGQHELPSVAGRGQFLIAIQGEGKVNKETFRAGEVLYVPPEQEHLEFTGEVQLLRTWVPQY